MRFYFTQYRILISKDVKKTGRKPFIRNRKDETFES